MSDRSKDTTSTPCPDLDVVPARYRDDVVDLFDTWGAVRGRNATLKVKRGAGFVVDAVID